MIYAIAIDDEPPALRVLERFCSENEKIQLVKTFTKTNEAMRYIEKFPVDLIFLDIQMPAISGLEFYKTIDKDIPVIFTTAFSEYAVEGFNLNALDYLLKPFTIERFNQSVNKLTEYYSLLNLKESEERFIFIRADYSLIKLKTSDIVFIEGLDDYLKIYVHNQKTIVARMTMKNMAERLPANDFVRIHRSFIVSLKFIEKIRNKTVHIHGRELPVGSSYETGFLSQLNLNTH